MSKPARKKKVSEFEPPAEPEVEGLEDHEIADSDDFSHQDLRSFLIMLLSAKKQLLEKSRARIRSGEIQLDTNEMADEVDLASASVEQNLTFKFLDRDRRQVAEINRAIEKISTGDYGYCEGTGEPIPKKRLELTPWTRYSVRHQEHLEKTRKTP